MVLTGAGEGGSHVTFTAGDALTETMTTVMAAAVMVGGGDRPLVDAEGVA